MSPNVIIEAPVKKVLARAGWVFTGRRRAEKVERLNALLETIYVDSRRRAQVEALEEAREIARVL